MRRFLIKIIIVTFVCAGCGGPRKRVPPSEAQEFKGRDEIVGYAQRVRRPVYRALVPLGWQRVDDGSVLDTKKPIVSFVLEEGLVLTVHTFPSSSLEERIAPAAQVRRWEQQLGVAACQITSATHGGFVGLYLKGANDKLAMRAWSMQLDMEHYQTLYFLASTLEEEEHYKQMAADYTIKVFGPPELLEKYADEIDLFAESFELIQELPTRC